MTRSETLNAEKWELILLETKHPGLSQACADTYCSSARVCLDVHHSPPTTFRLVHRDGQYGDDLDSRYILGWSKPTQRERNANLNHLDAARDGAYAIAFICLEHTKDFVVISRAHHGTGADWYVAPIGRGTTEAGEPDLEDPAVRRLEVGGHGGRRSLPYELSQKIEQLIRGRSEIPGLAVVVGFKQAQLMVCTGVVSA